MEMPRFFKIKTNPTNKEIEAVPIFSEDVVEVKHGEWIKGKEIAREMLADRTLHIDYENFTCSNCGIVLKELLYHNDGSPFYKFCPNCGADMRERKETE